MRGHFHELGADGAQDGAGLFEQAHGAGRVAGVVEGGDDAGVAFGAEIQLVVVNQAVNSAICTILVARAFSKRVPVMGDVGTSIMPSGAGPL